MDYFPAIELSEKTKEKLNTKDKPNTVKWCGWESIDFLSAWTQ